MKNFSKMRQGLSCVVIAFASDADSGRCFRTKLYFRFRNSYG